MAPAAWVPARPNGHQFVRGTAHIFVLQTKDDTSAAVAGRCLFPMELQLGGWAFSLTERMASSSPCAAAVQFSVGQSLL